EPGVGGREFRELEKGGHSSQRIVERGIGLEKTILITRAEDIGVALALQDLVQLGGIDDELVGIGDVKWNRTGGVSQRIDRFGQLRRGDIGEDLRVFQASAQEERVR